MSEHQPMADPGARPRSAVVQRYDRDADRYADHWAPVLEASARDLLERVAREAPPPPSPVIMDVGTGTGVLALAALERWPDARVIATDASAGMLSEAAAAAARRGPAGAGRLRFVHGAADTLALPDGSADLVVSSFVYQLVPDRAAALAEARRVLRPGGTLAIVTWLEGGAAFPPEDGFDEAVVDLDLESDDPVAEEVRAGDFRSVRAAAAELRRAGFRRVAARAERLAFAWSPEAYLAFKLAYEDRELAEELTVAQIEALSARAREHWAGLRPDDWTFRAELVSVIGRTAR
jgi:ubiquinone/menaquinone biosynthesis C-methylase UbiE